VKVDDTTTAIETTTACDTGTAPAQVRPFVRWHGRIKGLPCVVNLSAQTAGKARAEVVRMARDAGYRVDMRDAQVRRGDGDDINNVWPDAADNTERAKQ